MQSTQQQVRRLRCRNQIHHLFDPQSLIKQSTPTPTLSLQVKRAYMSMLLHVHPDKLAVQPVDYVELCSAAFPVLRDAYEAFKSQR
jgi:hypothetical protein